MTSTPALDIRHKSLREPPSDDDGLRIAVVRHTVGLRIDKQRLDYRIADAAPSDKLLKAWRAQEIAWEGEHGFADRYLREQEYKWCCTLTQYTGGHEEGYQHLHIKTKHLWRSDVTPVQMLQRLAQRYGRITLLCWEDLHTPGQEHCHRTLLARLVAGETKHDLVMEVVKQAQALCEGT